MRYYYFVWFSYYANGNSGNRITNEGNYEHNIDHPITHREHIDTLKDEIRESLKINEYTNINIILRNWILLRTED